MTDLRGEDFQRALVGRRELQISVKGRRTGREIDVTVWFVHEGNKIYLLPVNGSDTDWYKNILNDPYVKLKVGRSSVEVKVTPVSEENSVRATIDRFKSRYGAEEIRRWYTKLDVSVEIDLESIS